ncbi:MAG: hypothetical protein JJU02_14270 [Cryomorphaceae bacterium]|nr:hypothetical protein [Cryomorphaceae bacterium]
MWKFIRYEWKYWIRTPMLWIFLLINSLLIFGATTSDQIIVGGAVGNVFKNAPTVIQNYYGVLSLIGLLMTTAFMNATANRDFGTGMYQFVFSSPIKKHEYFFGKFIGALTISMIPFLGVSIGVLIGSEMPWVNPDRFGPILWSGHIHGFLAFAVFNTFIAGVILYGLAVVFRSSIVSFIGAMGILVLYGLSEGYVDDIEREWLANLLDPFGFHPFSTLSKYFTVEDTNTLAVPLVGQFLFNRLVWAGLALLILFGLYYRFSFFTKKEKSRKTVAAKPTPIKAIFKPKAVKPRYGFSLRTFFHLILFETKAVIKNPTFIIISVIGLVLLIIDLTSFTGAYGTTRYPVTYSVVDSIQSNFYIFTIAIITFYTGVLVWKERDVKFDEIQDVTSVSSGKLLIAKIFGLLLAIELLFVFTILFGVIAQLMFGYTRFELPVYFWKIMVIDGLKFSFLIVIAMFIHFLINNRYIGYFVFIIFIVVNSFIWSVLQVNSNMLDFGSIPTGIYSDMNGFGPFVPGIFWFGLYWTLFCGILVMLMYGFFIRGVEYRFGKRLAIAGQRIKKQAVWGIMVLVLFLMCGSWVYYNTKILNPYFSGKEIENFREQYELKYKQYEGIPQPRYISLDFFIDIFPYQRDLMVRAETKIVNKHDLPIEELHFVLPAMPDTVEIEIPGAVLRLNDHELRYRIYDLKTPMNPGDTLSMLVRSEKITRGFENYVKVTSITQNGTFFNNGDFMPVFGYSRDRELTDKNKRKKKGLPVRKRMAQLDENDLVNRANTYISQDADWVEVTTTISTAADQIAVAPGSLVWEKTEGDRRIFHYTLDHKSINFYAFISAKYEVARERWNDIDFEVYYHPDHSYNVPNMLRSMQKSLEYFTENFGPYTHKQCRIIEFPRYASFAQAFPGTMPYSEGIGFITDLRNVTEDDIDLVYYVVAHEMSHQYWAHQLIGADMAGSVMMSESFSQYAALMVMEKAYGRDKMKKFLKYEMDGYLRGRGFERLGERPLSEVENQGYIHYQKGSVVMYYLKEMIGESALNRALASLIEDYGYSEPPYPTSLSALRAFRAETPDSLQYLIDDLFENITLFSNRVEEAYWEKQGDEYLVTFNTVSEKFYADTLGKETSVPLDDYIDIGIFGFTENKKVLGKPLKYKRVKINQKENTYSFLVKEKPQHVGIDPYNYLVDRIPEDNVKKVFEFSD